MSDLTRRDALRVAAATSVAAVAGTALADDPATAKAVQREIPVYLKVPKNMSLKLKMPDAQRTFKEGAYKPAAFKPEQQLLAGNKVQVTIPYAHGHDTLPKVTLPEYDKINYILMTAERDCSIKVEVLYRDAEMNLSRCCQQCDGMLVCALPGTCVDCGQWSICCPLDGH